MDKIVDHLLVFQGNGVIQDFPGNYTQYREWSALKPKEPKEKNQPLEKKDRKVQDVSVRKKMTFKEKREFEQLEKDIAALEKEQKIIEEELCSGKLTIGELTEKSKRLPVLKDELDEKSMRWLELSELA